MLQIKTPEQILEDIKSDYASLLPITSTYSFNMQETVHRVTSTLSSVYSRGGSDVFDSRIFKNVTRLLLNNQKKAENVDTKSIMLVPDEGFTIDEDKLRILRARYRMWMRQVNFGKTLNEMTESRGNYGGTLVEKVKRDNGLLDIEVRQINGAYLDPSDLKNGDKAFRSEMKISDLSKKYGDSENYNALIAEYKKGKIEIWEIFTTQDSNVLLASEGKELIRGGDFTNQYYVLARCTNGNANSGKYFTLVSEVYTDERFKYLPYEKRHGITGNKNVLGIGIVEQAETAQMMTNFSVNAQKDIMSLASKVVIEAPVGSRLLKQKSVFNIKNGSVIETGHNILNMMPSAFSGLNSFIEQWDSNIKESTGALDLSIGETPPSGMSFALGAMLNQEARGYYDYRIEEMGLFLNEINQDWIIDFITKDINNSDFLTLNFTPQELKEIDMIARNDYANKRFIEDTLSGKFRGIKDPQEYIKKVDESLTGYMSEIGTALGKQGQTRTVDIRDLNFKGIKFRTYISVDNEARKTSKYIETLSAIALQKAKTQPGSQADRILDKALNSLGISPETLQ